MALRGTRTEDDPKLKRYQNEGNRVSNAFSCPVGERLVHLTHVRKGSGSIPDSFCASSSGFLAAVRPAWPGSGARSGRSGSWSGRSGSWSGWSGRSGLGGLGGLGGWSGWSEDEPVLGLGGLTSPLALGDPTRHRHHLEGP